MYIYILLIIATILFLGIVYYYFKPNEGFQDISGSDLLTPVDTTGLNLQQMARDLSNALVNVPVDNRQVNDASRQCDTIKGQIEAMEKSKAFYKTRGDWSTIRLTNSTINTLKEQYTSLGCDKNNT